MSQAARYAEFIQRGGEPLIGYVGGVRSTSGIGYGVMMFGDGSLLAILEREGGRIVMDQVDEPCTDRAYDAMCWAASRMARLPREQRALLARDCGATPSSPASVSGVRWTSEGDYAGLDWVEQPMAIGGAA
jgi:hypothetical protein